MKQPTDYEMIKPSGEGVRSSADECNCLLVVDESLDLYHYRRECPVCETQWWSLHCEHDGVQTKGCPKCDCVAEAGEPLSGEKVSACNEHRIVFLAGKSCPECVPVATNPSQSGVVCLRCGEKAGMHVARDKWIRIHFNRMCQPAAEPTASAPSEWRGAGADGGSDEHAGEISIKYPTSNAEIERCAYCDERHEVETTTFYGHTIKTCPKHPADSPQMTFIRPLGASRTAGEVDAKPVLDGMMPKVLARTIRDYYGHDGGSVQAANPDPCEKCDSEHSQGPHITICPESPASLQLLVIDMGDSCVLKAEKGTVSFQVPFHGGREFEAVRLDTEWRAQLVTRPFADVRAAIDALEGENNRPVPRIEREIDFEGDEMCYIFAEKDRDAVTTYIYDALSELAGKPLPVYKPKVGKWVKLQDAIDIVPIEVWRFILTDEGKST